MPAGKKNRPKVVALFSPRNWLGYERCYLIATAVRSATIGDVERASGSGSVDEGRGLDGCEVDIGKIDGVVGDHAGDGTVEGRGIVEEIPQRCLRLPSPVRGQGVSLVRCLSLYFDGTLSR